MMSETTAPPPPSLNPRWQTQEVAAWRQAAAEKHQHLTDEQVDNYVEACVEHLRAVGGVSEVTEDLVYVLWVTLPMWSAFVAVRTAQTCGNPLVCGASTMAHFNDGILVAAASLLELEQRIGKAL